MTKLARIRFDDGTEGYQETAADGALVRLYTDAGDQFEPGNCEWTFVRDVGEIDPDDSDTFWEALERDGVEVSAP